MYKIVEYRSIITRGDRAGEIYTTHRQAYERYSTGKNSGNCVDRRYKDDGFESVADAQAACQRHYNDLHRGRA